MANNNKQQETLVSSADEFQSPASEPARKYERTRSYNRTTNEVDEKTFDIDRYAIGDDLDIQPTTSAGYSSESQAKLISDLQFEIERLTQKTNGLDREVTAREEIAENISRESQSTSKRLELAESELQDRRHEVDFLQHSLRESTNIIADLSHKNEQLKQDSAQEIDHFRNLAEEHIGICGSNAQELRELREQFDRTEQYADSLRISLQSQSQTEADSTEQHRDREIALQSAEDKFKAVSEELAREREISNRLTRELEKQGKKFENELRQIRFELGTAQETITCQDATNEQLASDLFDNQGFRQALESQLIEVEELNQHDTRKLTKKLRQAQDEADEYERKMRTKDKAIAALMSELGNQGQSKNDDQTEERPIDNIAIPQPTRRTEQNRQNRTRIAKLLIGKTDGRELRFPLFKDRLTIGRTTNNDIQLNVRYISRRHAVLVTDNGQTRLVDWGSKNGVYVNNERISERFLKNGDVVTIGTTEFIYEERTKR